MKRILIALLLPQLNISGKTQAEIKNIKAQKRRRAGALQAFAAQRFFIYGKYLWQGLVVGAITILLISAQTVSAAEPMRGVWVATVGHLDYPFSPTTDSELLRAQANEIIDTCVDLGLNTIFLQVRARSDAIYPSKLYPYSADLTGEQDRSPSDRSDMLAYWSERAHDKGIALHAWINPYRVSTSLPPKITPNSIIRTHPQWVVYTDKAAYLDPGLPEVREYIISGINEILNRYDVDGIHFDDYFYPSGAFNDFNTYSQYGGGLDIGDWRRSNTEALIREAGEAAHAASVSFGVSPFGIWANKSSMSNGSDTSGSSSYYDMYADTLKWAKEGLVDYIAPQIYWYNGYETADYSILCSWWSEQLKDCPTKLYIGLADYRLSDQTDASSPWYDGNEIMRQMEMNAANENIDGEIHFSYTSITKNAPLYDKIRSFYSLNGTGDFDAAGEDSGEQKKATRLNGWLSKILSYLVRTVNI